MTQDPRLKLARIAMGFSQRELAAKVDCTENLISRLETGRATPNRDLAEKLAKLLNKPTFELGFH